MKKTYYFTCVMLLSACLWAGCGSHSHADHEHEGYEHAGHEHEGHAGHEHEGHAGHEHEGHEHAGHDHEHEGHEHGEMEHAEAGVHTDAEEHHDGEIHFSAAQAVAAGLAIEEVQPGAFTQVLKVSGEILSAEGDEQTLTAKTSGIVTYAHGFTMTDGAPVRQGQVLFSLNAEGMASGDPLQQAQAERKSAEEAWQRAERLWEQRLITRAEYEEARQRFQSSAKAKGASAVSAQTAGYLKQCLVASGQYVAEGQPLAVITRCKKLQLHADVSARHYNQLQGVQGADICMPYSDSVYHLSDLNGRLLSVGKATGLSTSSTDFHGSTSGMSSPYIPVIFEMDVAPGLFAGSFADVYLLCGERQGVISVPMTALTEEQGLFFVYVQVDDDGYRKQEVTLGQRGSERAEVLRGLKPGDLVVTRGAYQVKLASVATVAEGHHHH